MRQCERLKVNPVMIYYFASHFKCIYLYILDVSIWDNESQLYSLIIEIT